MSVSISTYCVVFGCPNKGSRKNILLSTESSNKTVTFHKFPNKKPESSLQRYKKWLKNINRENFVPKSASVVCSLHFTANCFISSGKLLGSAVPTLYMGSPPRYNKVPIDRWVQCEMGKETYRSQPGVKINNSQECEELDIESNPEISSTSHSNDKVFGCYSAVNNEQIKREKCTSPVGDHNNFMDVQCNLCRCGECDSLKLDSISTCCNIIKLENIKNDQDGDCNCITFDENFGNVVLDIHVIKTRLHEMILHCPPENVEYSKILKTTADNRLCRHVAYQQFRSWNNSRLNFGEDKIKTIPNCVLKLVRQKFPEDDDIYQQLSYEASNGQENIFECFD